MKGFPSSFLVILKALVERMSNEQKIWKYVGRQEREKRDQIQKYMAQQHKSIIR